MRIAVAALMSAVCLPAAAQTSPEAPPPAISTPETLSQVYACAELATDSERLACYDSAVGRLRQAETSGQVVAVDRNQVAAIERESFGFSLPSLTNILPRIENAVSPELGDVEMTITEIVALPSGRHRFVMSNGQVWTQQEPQRVHTLREGDTVSVRRAAMGSFLLAPPRRGQAHRVRRES